MSGEGAWFQPSFSLFFRSLRETLFAFFGLCLSALNFRSLPAKLPSYPNLIRGWSTMCRNIKPLFNFDPPVTPDEVRNASLQFVRKISGFHKPSKANEASFHAAIDEISASAARLLQSLQTSAPSKNREEEAAKARVRSQERFGKVKSA